LAPPCRIRITGPFGPAASRQTLGI
jgi:hypothetical protein